MKTQIAASLTLSVLALCTTGCNGETPCEEAVAHVESCIGQNIGTAKEQCDPSAACFAQCTTAASCPALIDYATTGVASGSYGGCLTTCEAQPAPGPSTQPASKNVCQRAADVWNQCSPDKISGAADCTGKDACVSACIAESTCQEISDFVNGSSAYTNTFGDCLGRC